MGALIDRSAALAQVYDEELACKARSAFVI
jgi:hypothetical protein